MGAWIKRWSAPRVAFLIGAAVAGAALAAADALLDVPEPVVWIAVPGIVLLFPIYVLTGGVHGGFSDWLPWLTPVANGFAYSLLVSAVQRIRKLLTPGPP